MNTLSTGAAFGIPELTDAGAAVGAQDLFSILQNLVASNVAAMGRPGVAGGSPAGATPPMIAQGFPLFGATAGLPHAAGAPGLPLQAGAPAVQAAPPGIPVLQGTALLGSLTQIQRGDLSAVTGGNFAGLAGAAGVAPGMPATANILHELKSSSVGSGMGAMDLMTLDIVAMLFDQIFDDPKVPNGVKGLIGRMQIPMLKVAIADKSFFSSKSHPARQLLDTLGDIASCLPAGFGPGDALFPRIESVLEELVSGYQDNIEIFATVREKLETLLDEEDRRVEHETRAAAKRVEEAERLALAKRVAEDEVRSRVRSGTLPQTVIDFLAKQWLKLLLLIHVREGEESPVWKRAVSAMDHLIWSIEPRQTHEERRKVVAVIPGLVKQLAVGMKAAGVGSEERSAFFAELMKLHREAITAPGELHPGSDPRAESPAAAGAEAALDLDFSQPVTVRNPFGDGDVNVSSLDLDFTAFSGSGTPAGGEVSDANPLASLVVGMWVGFREEGDPARPGKLIFVTPRKTRYLFSFDRAGKDIIPCTPAELMHRFRAGDAIIIEEPRDESLFDRIMKGLVGKLRATAVQRA